MAIVRDLCRDWIFVPDRVSDERRLYMEEPRLFEDVLRAVTDDAKDIAYRTKRGCIETKGHTRAEFRLSVTLRTYDLFFNSRSGYRAQFYYDQERGMQQNRAILTRLRAVLLDAASAKDRHATFTIAHVERSLDVPSAKIWINEDTSSLDQKSIDATALTAINVPHWARAARKAEASIRHGFTLRPAAQQKALLGVQAPTGTELKVLGAWLDDRSGLEFVAPSKRNRTRQIRVYGFA